MSNTFGSRTIVVVVVGKNNQSKCESYIGRKKQQQYPKKKLEIGYLFELKTNINLSRFQLKKICNV